MNHALNQSCENLPNKSLPMIDVAPAVGSASFSVVTCCYNQGCFLADNIESVIRQDYPALEHIVVDDGSTDDTRAVCACYPHVKYVYQKNAGQSAALNTGFRMARGDIVAWLNSDDYYAPGAFAAVAAAMPGQEARVIIHGHSQAVDAKGKALWKMASRDVERWRLLFHPDLYRWQGISCMPCQPSVFFHRRLLDEVGLLDVGLRYAMDYDLWLHALASGYEFRLVDAVFSYYRFHATSHSTRGFDNFLPEWAAVSHRHRRALPIGLRVPALCWRFYAWFESRVWRHKYRLQIALDGCNPASIAAELPAVKAGVKSQALLKVSVIMPVFNAAAFVQDAIDSVLTQTYPNWELIIVDDGSIDGTAAIAAKTAGNHPERIRFSRHPDHGNHGVSATRNLALREARGELIAFLDADDQWLPEKLERQVRFMLEHPSVKLSYTRASIVRTAGVNAFMPGFADFGDEPSREITPAALRVMIGHLRYAFSSVLVWRAAVEEVGGFMEGLPFQSEDRILVAQVAATGNIALLNETLCMYRTHEHSYSHAMALSGMAPLLFFDLQCRVLEWLVHQRVNNQLAKQTAELLIPRSFKVALAWSGITGQYRREVWRNYRAFAARSPLIAAGMLLNCGGDVFRRTFVLGTDRYRPDYEMGLAVLRAIGILKKKGVETIFLYGAGKHTQRLLASTSFTPLKIQAVVDDICQDTSVGGLPVVNPAQVGRRGKQEMVIVISSDTAQQRLFRQARRNGFKHVYRLYGR